MVAEQVLTYGLVTVSGDSRMARGLATLGPDESSRVDLVIRDLDVYRIDAVVESLRQDLELVEVRKSL